MATKRRSALQSAYAGLTKTKSAFCKGKKTKSDVKKAKAKYISAAVKKGQTRAEATKKANRVMDRGCKMSASIRKARKRK